MKKRPFAFKSQEGLRRSIIQLRCASENNLRRPTADSRSGPVKLPVRKGRTAGAWETPDNVLQKYMTLSSCLWLRPDATQTNSLGSERSGS